MANKAEQIGGAITATSANVRLIASFASAGFAETLTLPLDLAKTKLQVERREKRLATAPRSTLVGILTRVYREEGYSALWKGLAPALLRQTCYTSLSMVLYDPIRNGLSALSPSNTKGEHLRSGYKNPSHASFLDRLLAGGSAGAIAIVVFNWAEVIKVQIQVDPNKLGIINAARQIYASNGFLGFWAGIKPNITRTFIVNAAELGSYDQIKTEVFVPLVGNTFWSHLGASGAAGVISASVSTPVDVVKTRWMSEAGQASAGITAKSQGGMVRRGLRILTQEGVRALYAGFVPICVRKAYVLTPLINKFESHDVDYDAEE